MEPNFWHERWQRNEIGFHRDQVHPALPAHWASLDLPPKRRVLVPLCGKTLDLRWLAAQGHTVVGVELSELACAAFFEEAGLDPARTEHGDFVRWRAEGITLLQGNIFDLREGTFDAIYDRAATVALPPALRARYAHKLSDVLSPGGQALLVTLEGTRPYDTGPPFPVDLTELERCYGTRFHITPLHSRELAPGDAPPDLQRESQYRLTRRP